MMETYHGLVRTPADAIKLFEACRMGMLPRVQRRLSEKERQSIRSGSVFVWDEREAGMRRWTDGKSWSASRVSGSFLTYREMEGKRGNGFGGGGRRGAGKTPDSGRGSDEDQDDGEPDGYRYKADGLMKQSFSITTSTGQHLHLISYYSRPQPGQPELPQPTNDPVLRSVVPMKGMYPESSMNEAPVPAMTRTPMQPAYPPQQPPPHLGYPTQYVQPGYSWPPSPVATPPYSHGHYTTVPPYPPQLPPPPHHYAMHQPPPMHPQYPMAMPHPHYDRAPLPPPQSTQPLVLPKTVAPLPQPQIHPHLQHQQPPYPQAPHQSPQLAQLAQPRVPGLDSPRSQHLQAQAREAVQIDPRLAAINMRSQSGPLPPLGQQTAPVGTPPSRALSVSPPRNSQSDPNQANPGGNKSSLLALLHPTPTNSEPNSANPGSNSAGSSPRATAAVGANINPVAGQKRSVAAEDTRAIGMLDKKFCI